MVILSGAGISAESGIQTFRDSNGLWENYAVEDVATPQAWEKDPVLVQRFYNEENRCWKHNPTMRTAISQVLKINSR